MVARWGGEEFLVALPDTALPAAEQVAERLRRALAEGSRPASLGARQITMTFGIAQLAATEDLEACLERADQALYRGKQHGKDAIEVAALSPAL